MIANTISELLANSEFVQLQALAVRIQQFIMSVDDYLCRFGEEVIVSEGDGSGAITVFYNKTQRNIAELEGAGSSICAELGSLSCEAREKAQYLIVKEMCQYFARDSELSSKLRLMRLFARSDMAEQQPAQPTPPRQLEDYVPIY